MNIALFHFPATDRLSSKYNSKITTIITIVVSHGLQSFPMQYAAPYFIKRNVILETVLDLQEKSKHKYSPYTL